MALVKNQGGSNVSAFRYPCHKSICIGVAFRWMACANLRKSKNVSTFRSLSTSWFPHVCIKRSFQSPNLKPSQDSTEAWLLCFDCQWWKIHERLNVFFWPPQKNVESVNQPPHDLTKIDIICASTLAKNFGIPWFRTWHMPRPYLPGSV